MAAFKTCNHRIYVFLSFFFLFFFFFFLTMGAFKKRGSSLPKAAFYRRGFKFSLKPHV